MITMNVQGLPDKASVEDKDLSKKFQDAIDSSSILTLHGTDKDADYEWFYAENAITSSNDTDLKIYFTHEYDDYVRQSLQVTDVIGFYFAEHVDLNGFPTLTVKLRNWNSDDVSLYKLSDKSFSSLEVALAVNSNSKGTKEVTFQVNETDGIYFFVGGTHNYHLQGQGSASQVKADSENYDKRTEKSGSGNRDDLGNTTGQTIEPKKPEKKKHSNTSTVRPPQTDSGEQPADNHHNESFNQYVNDKKPSGKETKLASVLTRILSDGSRTQKDQYETDPVPVGKPEPVEPGDVTINYKKSYVCTLSIDCKTILDNKKDLTKGKESCVPEDGWILKDCKVLFYEGESAFDVLLRETQKRSIQMEYTMTPIYNSNYIEGIHNLYEFDCGSASGWMYKINGWYPNYGCSRYLLQDQDVIEWRYTCDYGADVGCDIIVK